MSLSTPSVVDRTKRWIKLLTRRSRPSSVRSNETTDTGFFPNSQDFTVNGGNFVNELKVNYINDVVSNKLAVFELLEPYACLGATKDSSARHPPPRCHPKTRTIIRERLMRWLLNDYVDWKMVWVRGSAGTGKSAVAQSFGDSCGERERHGASYFFSRTTGRNKPETVVPTLIYQLATTIPEYRSLVGRELVNNPLILRQSSPVQFRELIVEPFATLQRKRHRQPVVIILDGLDECEGESAQREIIDMITDAVQKNPNLPIRWLIFSRPEAHLTNTFSRNMYCGREELVIDAECLRNVERFVKYRLAEIKNTYKDVVPADWPPRDKLQQLLNSVSGLFIFASTCLNFIDNPDEADPSSQLDSLLLFITRSQGIVSKNPLAALDLLYSRVLEKIPPSVYKTTKRLLAYMCYRNTVDKNEYLYSAQSLSNFLRLDQHAFYRAARGLHSVTRIPEPKWADQSQIQFYHASFPDFLLDPNRSGKFVITKQDAVADLVLSGASWWDFDLQCFHQYDGRYFNSLHDHFALPRLPWVSERSSRDVSRVVINVFEYEVLSPNQRIPPPLDCVDQSFLARLADFDFRFWSADHIFCLSVVCRLDLSTSLVRVEPSSPIDYQLLEYFYYVIDNGVAKPATFPLRLKLPDKKWSREYFIIGHGVKSVIVWGTKSPARYSERAYSLRGDQIPSQAQVSEYRDFLKKIKWNEGEAKSLME